MPNPESHAPSSTPTIIFCYGAQMCNAIVNFLIPIYLTTWSQAFGGSGGLSKEQLGLIGSSLFSGIMVGVISSAYLAHRKGARLPVMLGAASICAGFLLISATWRYEILLVASFISGYGGGILGMIASPIVCAIRPHQKVSALNRLHSTYCIGGIFAALLASLAIHQGINWRLFFCAATLPPLTILIGFSVVTVPRLTEDQPGSDFQKLKPINSRFPAPSLINLWFLLALLCGAGAGAIELGISQWTPAYAVDTLHFNKTQAGMTLIGFAAVMGIGRMIAGLWGHRWHPITVMMLACVSTTLAILLGAFSPFYTIAIAACIAVGFTVSCMYPTILAITAQRFPYGGPFMFALFSTASCTGALLIMWIIGKVADLTTLRLGLATVATCPAFILAILLYFRHQDRPQHQKD